jgi:hypothetical protein
MPVPIEFRTPRLLLRRWRDSDREPFAAMNADYPMQIIDHVSIAMRVSDRAKPCAGRTA